MREIHGTGVALVTPFDSAGGVDFDGLSKLLTHIAKGGANYFVVQGTTGESATTTPSEKSAILEHVIQMNVWSLPIVYGMGGNNTQQILDNITTTDFSQINAILSVSPYYNKPSQAGIIAHYEKIADECPVPIVLYNVPGRTASNLTAETTLTLAQHPNIIGVKEASGSVEQAMAIAKNKPDDFLLISGDDMLTPALLSLGGVGVISVLANAFPKLFATIIESAVNHDFEKAYSVINSLSDINPLMYAESNPVGIKEVLYQLGICGNGVRLPLLAASPDLRAKIKAGIAKN